MKKAFLAFIVGFLLVGCSQRLGVVDTFGVINKSQISEKNYVIGKAQTSYVGEPLIKVNDYLLVETKTNVMKPDKDFIFDETFAFREGEPFEIKDSYKRGDKTYIAITNSKIYPLHFLVDENGTIQNKILNMLSGFSSGEFVTLVYTYEYKPQDVKMIAKMDVKNQKTKNGLNYELIYTGRTSDAMMLAYREYTPDDLARPSFFQNLTYNTNQKQIRFKNLLLEILSVNNEKITFKVLRD